MAGAKPSRRRKGKTKKSKALPPVAPHKVLQDTAQAVALVQLRVTAAQTQAAFVQKYVACHSAGSMDVYTCCQVDWWELPYSRAADPLATQGVEPWALEQQQQLRHRATQWVSAAAAAGAAAQPTRPPWRSPASLNISPCSSSFFAAAPAGLVVYEPFGGLCAGLERVLRNGLPVAAYF